MARSISPASYADVSGMMDLALENADFAEYTINCGTPQKAIRIIQRMNQCRIADRIRNGGESKHDVMMYCRRGASVACVMRKPEIVESYLVKPDGTRIPVPQHMLSPRKGWLLTDEEIERYSKPGNDPEIERQIAANRNSLNDWLAKRNSGPPPEEAANIENLEVHGDDDES